MYGEWNMELAKQPVLPSIKESFIKLTSKLNQTTHILCPARQTRVELF